MFKKGEADITISSPIKLRHWNRRLQLNVVKNLLIQG